MLAVHRDAAVKTPRRLKRQAAPVQIITIDPLVMALAREMAGCPCPSAPPRTAQR